MPSIDLLTNLIGFDQPLSATPLHGVGPEHAGTITKLIKDGPKTREEMYADIHNGFEKVAVYFESRACFEKVLMEASKQNVRDAAESAQEVYQKWRVDCDRKVTSFNRAQREEEKRWDLKPVMRDQPASKTMPMELEESVPSRSVQLRLFGNMFPIAFPESNVRGEVDVHSDCSEMEWSKDATVDPFDEQRDGAVEVAALLSCIEHDDNPAKIAKWRIGAAASLPFPFNETPFIDDFVTPLFAQFVGENGAWNKDGPPEVILAQRLERAEAFAAFILEAVTAADKEWHQALSARKDDLHPNEIAHRFRQCRRVLNALRNKAHAKLHGRRVTAAFERFSWAVALMRAEERVKAQMNGKPMLADDLPEPPMDVEDDAAEFWSLWISGDRTAIELEATDALLSILRRYFSADAAAALMSMNC